MELVVATTPKPTASTSLLRKMQHCWVLVGKLMDKTSLNIWMEDAGAGQGRSRRAG